MVKNRDNYLLILTLGVSFVAFLPFGSTFDCTRDGLSGRTTFRCPRPLFDDDDDIFCCGPPSNQYCCEDDEYLVSIGTGAIAAIIIGALILVASLILLCCCCCSCCYLAKRRQQRGVVLNTGTPKPATQINVYPNPNQGYTQVPYGYSAAPPGQMMQPPYVAPQQQLMYTHEAPYPIGGDHAAPPYPTQPMPTEYAKPPPYSNP